MQRQLILLLATVPSVLRPQAAALPEFDFTQDAVCAEWQAVNHISALRPTPEGLEIASSGNDPFLHGPARDYPAGVPLRLRMRVKSEAGGLGQVFYFRDHATEERSARFPVKAGGWTDVRVMLPELGPGYRLRMDPPGAAGKTVIAFLRFESATSLTAPHWPQPEPVDFTKAIRLRSGPVELQVEPRGFSVAVDGQ